MVEKVRVDEASSSQNQGRTRGASLSKRIEFYKHALDNQDRQEVIRVLESLFLTTGSWVSIFEQKFAAYLSLPYTVGVMSCTHALELCLRYFDIGSGDEVITTPLSFVATANAIEYVGARPVFVDVEEATGNIDVSLIERAITPRTKAIIPVHLYGQMVDMCALYEVAKKYNLKVIEDAAHCVEGDRDGIRVGQLSDAACFSFYATKNITCGEGGAIATHDKNMYQWLLQARSHGLSSNASQRYSKKYEHYDQTFLGIKSNMNNIQAALLIHQLERIEELWQKRHALWNKFEENFNAYNRPQAVKNSKHAHHLYTLWAPSEHVRDTLLSTLYDAGISCAVHYKPIHLMSYYKNKYGYQKGDFLVAESIGKTTLSLPFYVHLSVLEVHVIKESFLKEYENAKSARNS